MRSDYFKEIESLGLETHGKLWVPPITVIPAKFSRAELFSSSANYIVQNGGTTKGFRPTHDGKKFNKQRVTRIILTILLLIVTLSVSTPCVVAQSITNITGIVTDAENGTPIPDIEVQLSGTSYKSISDNSGRFSFQNIPVGEYAIETHSLAYKQAGEITVQIVTDIPCHVIIRMFRQYHLISGVTVSSGNLSLNSQAVVVVSRQRIQELHARDLSDVLDDVEGIQIERTGSGGGEARVRIRGSNPEHVLVLVDGQKINPSGTGVANLNTVPIEMIERVEIYKGGSSAEFGPDALAGVINIITQQSVITNRTNAELERVHSSWHSRKTCLSLINPAHRTELSTRLSYSSNSSDGDFDFAYRVEPADTIVCGTRINNQSTRNNYFGSAVFLPWEQTRIRFSGQVFESRNGLPDKAREQNTNAFKEDDRVLMNLSLDHEFSQNAFSQNSRIDFQIGLSRFEQYFWDRLSRPSNQFESRSIDNVLDLRTSLSCSFWKRNSVKAGFEFERNKLEHIDYIKPRLSTGVTRRETLSAFVRDNQSVDLSFMSLFDRASLDLAVRYDKSTTTPEDTIPTFPWEQPRRSNSVEKLSPGIGVAISRSGEFSLAIRGSWGKSFRLPSINALFWKGDIRSQGNPDLRPELSEHSEFGVEFQHNHSRYTLAGGVIWFWKDATDLVVWVQSGGTGVWKPINLGMARTTGHEDFLSLELFDKKLELAYRNTITDAKNKVPGHNSYDKYLTYVPHYISSFTARYNTKRFYGSYSTRLVARRYALESNEKWYDSYRIGDLTIGIRTGLHRNWQLEFECRINNVHNEDYVLIAHYPMPRREQSIGIKLLYGGS